MNIQRFLRYSLLALLVLAIPASSFAGVVISVGIAPPALPVYAQPPCPGDGYIWTPGYWAYGPDGYYWVPGTWVVAPQPGLLWTPGYWGWGGGAYIWHAGYWGPHVGFYGGVNYGFGYFGTGFAGGYWHGRTFFYNRSVMNVNITNVHVYNRVVIHNDDRISFNGGRGGIEARPTRDEERWDHERHFEPTAMQMQHEHAARENREFLASVNHGRPAIAATARPGEFHGRGAVAPRPQSQFRPAEGRPMNREVARPQNSAHNMYRAAPHQEAMSNHGGRANNAPRPENRGNSGPRATANHSDHAASHGNTAHEQGGSHGNAPHGGDEHGKR
jgi:WXXGXW repeat (2 copies)